MISRGDEHMFTVTAEFMSIDYELPLSMSDGAGAPPFRLVDTRDTAKPTEEMTS